METQWHNLSVQETYEEQRVSEKGLSTDMIQERQMDAGRNELPQKKSDPWWKVLLRQFLGPMILILIFAAAVSGLLHEWVDVGVILAAVFLNAIIGFVQEYKANKALEQLRSLVQPHALVIRNGEEIEISAEDLVPGDVLVLNTGDRVTADVRVVESIDMMLNEAALTGESFPVAKQSEVLDVGTLMADRTNMAFTGTSVVGGRGRAIVVATGVHTELGRVASMVQQAEEVKTPLQEQLTRLARWIALVIGVLIALLFVLGLSTGEDLFEMFEMSVALAVAAVPEGLVVSVTVILAIGMQRILKRNALVRRLLAAETLGSVSVICSDKTGTITEGKMRVTHLVTSSQTWHFPLKKRATEKVLHEMLDVMALCNDASVLKNDGEVRVSGSPTEHALMMTVLEHGIDPRALQHKHPRTAEVPFDSAHKYMVTAHQWGKQTRVLAKGAPGKIYSFCDEVLEDGGVIKLSAKRLAELRAQELELTKQGIRLIAVAVKHSKKEIHSLKKDAQSGFTFYGFIGLRDPLRPEAAAQISAAKKAGVRTVIITGDHPETARAIGAEAGLIAGPESVVIGSELDDWTDHELQKRVNRIAIYARVEPRHKIRIVHAFQSNGEVVAMTGDGVNDAPALKAADIGLAVGSGTEVAKQASDVVILDNNLSSITAAIEEGRVMFDNIRKTSVYLLSGSFTEIALIAFSIMLGLPLPLLPVQILWINLVADSFPNIGLTLEKAESDVMRIPPRPRNEGVLNKDMMIIGGLIGSVTIVTLMGLYLWLLQHTTVAHAQSVMFAAVGIDTLIYVFAVKSFRKTIFHVNPFANPWLILGVLAGLAIMLVALLVPFFREVLELEVLMLSDWGLLLMMALGKLFVIELLKGLL
ncbi:MAG: HAD-IC family P-type ATPase, partial [bacterium]|nr:HAD-IC family P-type ATPase [bacterium]